MAKYFLFKHKDQIWLVDHPDVVPKPRELLLQNSNIEIIRDQAKNFVKGLTFKDKVSRKKHPKHTEEHKRKISLALRGRKTGRVGLKEETKAKIRRTMRGTRREEDNPFYGRRHSEKTKRIMAIRRKMKKMKWCVEPSGKTHFVPEEFELPENWLPGRIYDPYKPKDFFKK